MSLTIPTSWDTDTRNVVLNGKAIESDLATVSIVIDLTKLNSSYDANDLKYLVRHTQYSHANSNTLTSGC